MFITDDRKLTTSRYELHSNSFVESKQYRLEKRQQRTILPRHIQTHRIHSHTRTKYSPAKRLHTPYHLCGHMKSIQQKHLTSKHFDSFVSIFFLFF